MESGYWPLWIQLCAHFVGSVLFWAFILWALVLQVVKGKDHRYHPAWHASVLPITAISVWLVIAPAYHAAWEERNVGTAFARLLVLHAIYYSAVALSVGVAAAAGWFTMRRTRLSWLGWFTAFLVFFAVESRLQKLSPRFLAAGNLDEPPRAAPGRQVGAFSLSEDHIGARRN